MRNYLLPLLLAASCLTQTFASEPRDRWTPVGPYGGDARSLAYDPRNPDKVYAGTATGEIFVSEDFGRNWNRLSHVGATTSSDYVVDHIVVTPQGTLFAAAWTLLHEGGGIFRSDDAGRTWTAIPTMQGKSVRSLTLAPSDSKTLVAGALDGVYRSQDGGKQWERISPATYKEIKNVESIAIDPHNPEIIYAGTWHLPWKTEDGGKTWHHIHNGILDDSDVFSIIVDPKQPSVVYASACSGIYKSDSAGELFHKAQGIPFTARRTRVLEQDPINRQTVYAGTTEGLWRTSNAGAAWKRLTAPSMIVNDVLVDPRNSEHVLLATDRDGILSSSDGGVNFRAANEGFSQRIVSSIAWSKSSPETLYAGLIKDKESGGVFVSHDLGAHWQQISRGLGDRDVYVVRELPNGTVAAGTEDGIFVRSAAGEWRRIGELESSHVEPARPTRKKGAHVAPAKYVKKSTGESFLNSRINALENVGNEWLAATSNGLYRSEDELKTWHKVETDGVPEVIAVAKSKDDLVIAGRSVVKVSSDGGRTWRDAHLKNISSIVSLAVTPNGQLWAAAREGVFHSFDHGNNWMYDWKLSVKPIAYMGWVPGLERIVVAGRSDPSLYETTDGADWTAVPAGWLVRGIVDANGKLIAATAFDGVVVQSQP